MNVSAISGVTRLAGINSVSQSSGIDGIRGAASVGTSSVTSPVDGTNGAAAPGSSFVNALSDAFGSLNTQLNAADATMADFASGGSADLHTVMLEMEEASISLKLGVQVRDKLIEAYQEIMRTQV